MKHRDIQLIKKIISECNDINISIIITKLTGDISGFFVKKNETGLVAINANRSLGHQYFTAAHEYCHIKYDIGMNGRICPIKFYEDQYNIEIEIMLILLAFANRQLLMM